MDTTGMVTEMAAAAMEMVAARARHQAPLPAPRQDQVRLAALLEAVRVIIGTRRERTDLWMEVDGR